MKRPLAQFSLLASILSLLSCGPQEKPSPSLLTMKEAENAESVKIWIEANKNADHKIASQLFQKGKQEKQRGAWSSANKYFGESMIRYPSPQALSEYIETYLRMLALVRAREGRLMGKLDSDMAEALRFYQSAMTADEILQTLSSKERLDLQDAIHCLEAYAASGRFDLDCQPLRWYYDAAR